MLNNRLIWAFVSVVGLIFVFFLATEFGWDDIFRPDKAFSEIKKRSRVRLDDDDHNAPAVFISWDNFNMRCFVEGSKWMVIHGKIYDVSNFASSHPGGKEIIESYIGTDATLPFQGQVIRNPLTFDFTNKPANELVSSSKKLKKTVLYKKHSVIGFRAAKNMIIGQIENYKKSMRDGSKTNSEASSKCSSVRPSAVNMILLDDIFRVNIKKMLQFNSMKDKKGKGAISMLGIHGTHYTNLHLISKTLVVHEKCNAKVFRFRFGFDNLDKRCQSLPGDFIELALRIEVLNKSKKQENESAHKKEYSYVIRRYTPTEIFYQGYVDLFIKIYTSGKFTSVLDKLRIGDRIRARGPMASNNPLNTNAIHGCFKNIVFFAAGTGITPALMLFSFYRAILEDPQFQPHNDPFYPNSMHMIIVNRSIQVFIKINLGYYFTR